METPELSLLESWVLFEKTLGNTGLACRSQGFCLGESGGGMSSHLEELPLGSLTSPWEALLVQIMGDVEPMCALYFISYCECLHLSPLKSYSQPISHSHSGTTYSIPVPSFQNFKFNRELIIFIFKLGLANPLHFTAVQAIHSPPEA